jgi:hypothetical protein
LIQRSPRRILAETNAGSSISLRIAIDKQSSLFGERERCGQVNCGGSLTNSTFLVGYGDDSTQLLSPRAGTVSQYRCDVQIVSRGTIFVSIGSSVAIGSAIKCSVLAVRLLGVRFYLDHLQPLLYRSRMHWIGELFHVEQFGSPESTST